MSNSLTREDLIDGLRELVAGLRRRGTPVGIRLVGGAALAIRYFERRATHDVDILREGRAALRPGVPPIAL